MSRERWIPLGAAALVAALSLIWLRQGLQLLGDGLWLLGAEAALDSGLPGRALALPDGPARYWTLAGFFLALGRSAATLAVLKAVLVGCATLVLLGWTRGSRRWLALPAVWALAPFPLASILLLGLGFALERDRARLGVACALALGLHGWIPGLAAVALGLSTRHARVAAVAAVGTLVGVGLSGNAWEALVAAGSAWEPGASVRTFLAGRLLHLPFGEFATGESGEPAWPGHAALRAASFRLWILWLFVAPWLASRQARAGGRTRDPATALALLALAGWLARPDLTLLGPAAVLTLPTLLRLAPRGIPGRAVLAVVLVVALLPPAAERAWLSLRVQREAVVVWERERAEILLTRERIRNLERVVGSAAGEGSVWFWPAHPGLHFLFDVDAPRHVVLPRTAGAQREAVADLAADPPRQVLLGLTGAGAAMRIRRTAPLAWEFLRAHYEVEGDVAGVPDEFRALRLHDGDTATLPLPQQLPDVALSFGNDASPPLVPDLAIGQTLRLGPADLAGVSVRWATSGRDLRPTVRIAVWTRGQDGGFTRLLDFFDAELQVPGDGHRSWVRFGPVAETADQEIALTFEVQDPTAAPLHLVWHRHDAGRRDLDLYPEGTARINGEPVDADLYLSTYGASPIP